MTWGRYVSLSDLPAIRNRWEQEVRERLVERENIEALARFRYEALYHGVAWGAATYRLRAEFCDEAQTHLEEIHAAIFGEAEPVEKKTPWSMAEIVDELAAHPEVRWDRFIEYAGKLRVYGWLDRSDGRSDFLLLDFDPTGGLEWVTSASPHPASVIERLESDDSADCKRVEDYFDIPNAVRLQAEPVESEDDRGALADPDAAEGEGADA